MMTDGAGGGRMMDVGGGPRARDDAGGLTGAAATGAEPGGTPADVATPGDRPASTAHHAASTADAPTDVADLREIIRDAAGAGTALRLVGAGRWLDAGRPVRASRRIDLRGLSGIVEHVPGDLTMTARAGTPLAELQAAALAAGQFVPLDPWGDDLGTLGATLATASAGPLAGAFGLPRDVVLGVTAVTGTGELIRAGGRVVKNVAGFDLVRLMVGAWGTLGVLTEATVRLRALPEGDETLVVPVGSATVGAHGGLAAWLTRLRSLPVHPLAAELVGPALALTLGVEAGDAGAVLLVRIAGNEAAMAAQRAALATLGDPMPAPTQCWPRLRAADGAAGGTAGAVLRLSAPPADLAACWRAAGDLMARADAAMGSTARATAHASVTRGVVRVCLPPLADTSLRSVLGDSPPAGITRRFERLPAGLWPIVAPSAVADPLSLGVRRAFDPRAILNPGILGAENDSTAHSAGAGWPGAGGGITPAHTSPLT